MMTHKRLAASFHLLRLLSSSNGKSVGERYPVAGLVEKDIQVQVLWWRKISRCRRCGGERYPDTDVVVEKAPMSDLQVEASVTQPGPGNSCSI